MKKKILFIMNPISGTASKAAVPSLIDSGLDKELFEYEIRMTERAGHASEIATEAKNNHVDVVVAVGGDGTVNEVINQCQIRDLDYGVINDHPFFCTCGMGFDAFVSMKFAESGKRGPITYAENILREGLKYKPETYTLEDETGTKQYKAFLISCANASQYGNNAYIAPQASMSDGLMDVVIMEPFDVIEAPQVSFDMFNKTLDKNSKIKSFRCKKLHITRSQPGVIHYDGDPVMTGAEIDVHLEEKGIKMLVNPFANKNDRKPNMIQSAFADFFNDINAVRDDIHKDIQRQSKRVEAISKLVQKKLNL